MGILGEGHIHPLEEVEFRGESLRMNVLLFQVDGKIPNLALMRLARYHRDRGDSASLVRNIRAIPSSIPDRVYSSSIFTESKPIRDNLAALFPEALTGGDGYKPIWNNLAIIGKKLGSSLTEVITDIDPNQIVPDFSDYPEFDASLGYTQRGCRLDCAFCRMKTREGDVMNVGSLHSIWRGSPYPKKIFLLDNDFFGQPEWSDILNEAIQYNFRVCFNQGINIRLINAAQAQLLSKVRYSDDQFSCRRLYTAWDQLHDERAFKRGISTIIEGGVPAKHIMVYMLIGFRDGETEEEILHRFNEIRAIGCLPYPMLFRPKATPRLRLFQRWVLRRYYKFIKWEDFNPDLTHGRN